MSRRTRVAPPATASIDVRKIVFRVVIGGAAIWCAFALGTFMQWRYALGIWPSATPYADADNALGCLNAGIARGIDVSDIQVLSMAFNAPDPRTHQFHIYIMPPPEVLKQRFEYHAALCLNTGEHREEQRLLQGVVLP